MKARTTAWVACVAMLASCAFVYTITPTKASPDVGSTTQPDVVPATPLGLAAFAADAPLRLDARLGYASLPKAGARENMVLLQVTGSEADTGTQASELPIHTSLVIDTSGSMQGERLQQAVNAAIAWMQRLEDGDQLSVIGFNGTARLIVTPRTLSASTRPPIRSALLAARASGNTCMSCGIELAQNLLRSQDGVRRMIVLSDGHANDGLRSLPQLRSLGRRNLADEISIVTLGLGNNYNAEGLALLGFETNGSHHFVEDASALGAVFAKEASKLTATVATRAEAVLTLPEGVELVRVFDRAHHQQAGRIVIPLGTFARGQTKTVLAEVRVRGDQEAVRRVVDVSLQFEDSARTMQRLEGHLSVAMADRRSALDPSVAVRLAKSEGAAAFEEAASLFEQGRRDEAVNLLDRHQKTLDAHAAVPKPAPAARALASAMATTTALRDRLQAAPQASARAEVLRSKETRTRELE